MNEARKAFKKAAENLTAEEAKLTSIFLNGLIYARKHPENKAAAALIEQIQDIISGKMGAGRQDVINLTYRLDEVIQAATWGMKE